VLPGRLIVIVVLLLPAALAGGCGGDGQDDGAADEGAASTLGTGAQREQSATSGRENEDATTDQGSSKPSPDAAEEKPTTETQGDDERRSAPAKDRDKAKRSPSSGKSAPGTTGTPVTPPKPARAPLTGAALRRCLRRSISQHGARRVRTQASCVGMSYGRFRRLIVANCRRAMKTEAEERRCIRLALDE
jgi:hypothetical protein